MTFNSLTRLFTARRYTEDGSPVPMIWVGNKDRATLINPEAGRAYAHISHDGCGKYYTTVVVSPWRAFHLVRHEAAALVSLLSFPRCTVELYRLRAMVEAQETAEYALGFLEPAE